MVSLKKIFTDNNLSIEDLSYLSKLLDTNMSINNCLDLLENKKNKTIFLEIKRRLNQGQLIEKIICDYLPSQIKVYMLPLLNNVSFANALSISLQFNEKHNKSSTSFLSSIAYPCILLFVTITALYLFDLYGLDSIFNLISSFDGDISLYEDIRYVFRIVIIAVYYGVLIITLLVVILSRPSKITLLYLFLSKHFPNSLVNIYYSEEFISLLLICVNKGYKTKEALRILKDMKAKPVISFLAFHLDENLLQGDSLNDAIKKKYYDSSLSRFMKIACYSNDFSGILISYISLARQRIESKMKQYSLTIQICTYLFIGAIIIFIYQILFMPMQAISTF